MPLTTGEGETLGGLLARTRQALREAETAAADLDARLIVEHFSRTSRLDAVAAPDQPVATSAARAIDDAVRRRIAGEPVHRILGHRAFHGLDLALHADTLEPRPDTETLVDQVLPFVSRRVAETGRCRVLDLGTGTGAIALAVLAAQPLATALGVDLAEGAVETARANAEAHGLSARFEARRSNWFSAVAGRFDLVVSNPPYIESAAIGGLDIEVRDHDPRLALDGGPDGLDAYRTIAAHAAAHLEPGGRVAVEIGFDQRDSVRAIFASSGFRLESEARDLGNHVRGLMFAG